MSDSEQVEVPADNAAGDQVEVTETEKVSTEAAAGGSDKSQEESEPQGQQTEEPKSEPDPEPIPEAKPEADPEPKQETDPEPKSEAPEPKSEAPEPKSEAPEPASEQVGEPEVKNEADPEPKPKTDPEPKSEAPEPASEQVGEPEVKAEGQSEGASKDEVVAAAEGDSKTDQEDKSKEGGVASAVVEVEPKEVSKRERVRTVDPAMGVDLAMGSSGVAAAKPVTVGEVFRNTYHKYPNRAGLRYKDGDQWISVTFTEYYANCLNAAKSFMKIGLKKYHGVCILGFNSPEWFYSNIGAMFAGGLAAGIYATNGPDACKFIIANCNANVVVVENQKQLDKILQIRDDLPELKAIVQYKGKLSQEYANVYDWNQFLELGKDIPDEQVEEAISNQKPEDCCLLVYTSGTTGDPKGVMLSHDNLTWTARGFFGHLSAPIDWELGSPAHLISYLPLSHIAGQMADMYMPLYAGVTVNFAQPDALKGSIKNTLEEVKPTLFFGVPRVWEKFMDAIQVKAATFGTVKKKVLSLANSKAFQAHKSRQNKESLPWGSGLASMVLKKVKEQLGLHEAKCLLVGAAPVHRDVLEFFMQYDVPVLELYGMSENTGPATSNTAADWRLGTVGKAFSGSKIKIYEPDENGEGEICMYGRHVFMGYLNNEVKTKEAIDEEGWLHSGDIGKIDKDGYLSITGRIKELIITSGGENIAPVPIEDKIKQAVPFISNVMLIGDKRKYVTCLITLKCVIDLDTAAPVDELQPLAKDYLAQLGCELTKPSEIAKQKVEVVMKKIQEGLDKANETSVSRAQKVQKFTLLDTDFSVAGGELGPTLKLKRRIVVDKYSAAIEAMYEESKAA